MKDNRRQFQTKPKRGNGFSTLELLLVMVVSLVIAALSIPGFNEVRRNLRISGDGRDLNGAINQAKLQAAAYFTTARVVADLGANTFHIEIWNKTGGPAGNGCWQTLGDTNNPCTPVGGGGGPVQTLSQNVTFGTAGVGAAPPNTQALFGQAPGCQDIFGGNGLMPNTACVVFNSRGIPISSPGNLAPTGNDAFYITDNTVVYAVTVNPTGLSQVWATSANGGANWYHK